ncbi:MAG TPA: leucyl aminopeptidase [Candidatus Kapabacteria bacterium]|nr:leucyl aminopeptidase [Candidatus Kapabacteria bacterium]
MNITVTKADWKSFKCDALACFQPEDKKWLASAMKYYDKGSHLEHMAQAMLDSGDMAGKKDELLVLYPLAGEVSPTRLLLVGMGKPESITLETVRRVAARAAKKTVSLKGKSMALYLPSVKGAKGAEVATAAVEGIVLGLYKWDKYKKKDDNGNGTLSSVTILADEGEIAGSKLPDIRKAIDRAQIICAATIHARNMENEPSNNKYPEILANWAKQAGSGNGIKVTVLADNDLKKNKMVGIIAVGQGSAKSGRFIIMEYKGAKKKDAQPIVLVGKGITFDTGGISLKPGAGMGDMISDMSGAATVIATLKAVADLKLPINVIGLCASAENMPSGTASRPGDIITYPNGVSAEIDNTDAEGRLVLADALIWAKQYNPKHVIDLATLTGACVVALGHITTGMMGTDEKMKAKLKRHGDKVYERVCELPIYDEYDELIKSDCADVKNTGGRWGGAITAAMFLKKFVDYPWVHLDIAGTARGEANLDYINKGGTGVCVRLLTEMLTEEAGK